MRVESINKNKLVVYENNPRNNDKAKEYVKESIEKFGYLNPIIVNKFFSFKYMLSGLIPIMTDFFSFLR